MVVLLSHSTKRLPGEILRDDDSPPIRAATPQHHINIKYCLAGVKKNRIYSAQWGDAVLNGKHNQGRQVSNAQFLLQPGAVGFN